ncbi:substrate-binding domain-containing protein [Frankia sp. Cr2]|uniref:PstS family phosphate ABC transporter substrate-binding protein n=1 Tax=Frankia sp. Cr2 TaxID=3073932 RepID=UPI002AD38D6F|nr:substrate-binding domain-containing protein [Frankia sp. Cr2]
MHIPRKAARTVAVAVTALAVAAAVAVVGPPVLADPPAGVTPATGDIVGVGSTTTRDVMNRYSTAYDAQNPTPSRKLYSWDPGQHSLPPKKGCVNVTWPTDSDTGIRALHNDAAAYNTSGVCVDFARSSRYPDATRPEDANKTFIAFARDAMTWAAMPVTPKRTPKNLTVTQLRNIYLCVLTDWHNANPALPSGPIQPYLPSGSDTRTTFLRALSNSGDANGPNPSLTPGSCVRQPAAVESDSGVSLQVNLRAGDTIGNVLMPYSAGAWVAQSRGGDAVDLRNGFTVRQIDGVPAAIPDVAAGAAGPYSLNPNGRLPRLLFNVVKNNPANNDLAAVSASYATVFGKAGYICTHPLSADRGFLSLPTSGTGPRCGDKYGLGSAPPSSPQTGGQTTGGWLITVYYTAVEGFHHGPPQQVRGCPRQECTFGADDLGTYPTDFVQAVRDEGAGRITSGTRAGTYLNWSYDTGYWLDAIPADTAGHRLEPFQTAGADAATLGRGTRFTIASCGMALDGSPVDAAGCTRLRAATWTVRDEFTPGLGGDKHIDLYIGEEDRVNFTASPLYLSGVGARITVVG